MVGKILKMSLFRVNNLFQSETDAAAGIVADWTTLVHNNAFNVLEIAEKQPADIAA